MKYILLIFLSAIAFQQVITLNLRRTTFEELNTCLINSGVPNETIFDQDSKPEEYNKLNSQWNTRNGIIYPLAYLVAEKIPDIQKAVICGKTLNIRVLPKAGGHNFEKYTYGDSHTLVVDLRKLNYVNVDKDRQVAVVGAGTRQGKFAYNLWEQGNFVSSYGLCPSVGVAGYTLGGGKGQFSRRHGLMIDTVVEMQIIDSSGRLLVVNNETNADLFWALRGAGAVSFGIVTEFTFRIYKAPIDVYTYFLTYDMSDSVAVMSAFLNYTASNLVNTFGNLQPNMTHILLRFDELHYEGEEYEYDRLISLLPTSPYNITGRTDEYPDHLMELAMQTYATSVLPNVNVTHPENLTLIEDGIGQSWYHRKSFQLSTQMSTVQINGLFQLINAVLPSRVWLEEYGGKVNEYGLDESAFIHRNDLLILTVAAESPTDPDLDWLNRARTFLTETQSLLGHTTTYQNYVDGEIQNYLERYYGSNLPRLIEIKTKYDPENFFHTPQSIPIAKDNAGSGAVNILNRFSAYYSIIIIFMTLKQIFC